MKIQDLSVGLKLELQTSSIQRSFISEIEGVESVDKLDMATPIYEGKLYPIEIEERITVWFTDNNNLYEFKAKVVERSKESNISIMKIKITSDIYKIQRREFFRYDCAIPVNYRVLNSLGGADVSRDYVKAVTKDLSGGGICIRLNEKVEYGKKVECELFFSEKEKIFFVGKVVRSSKYDKTQGSYNYEIGVVFEAMQEKERQTVIGFIYQEQRRLLKKG
jgi:c-di-GMP-binding flagellar brake protein YcgR